MLQVLGRMITFLILTVALLVEPRSGLSASPGALDQESVVEECAKKLETMFSLVTIQLQELALDHVKVRFVEQQYIVVIPLKEPRGDMKAIQWSQKDANLAMDFIRFLRQGKIGAVNVWPFLHAPSELYIARGISRETLKSCQKEQLREAFGKCTQCEVAEFLNLKP